MAILEIEQKSVNKEKWKKWWSLETKIETLAALISAPIVIAFWDYPLTLPLFSCFVALWCFGKIFFQREKWALLSILALFFLYRGLVGLLT